MKFEALSVKFDTSETKPTYAELVPFRQFAWLLTDAQALQIKTWSEQTLNGAAASSSSAASSSGAQPHAAQSKKNGKKGNFGKSKDKSKTRSQSRGKHWDRGRSIGSQQDKRKGKSKSRSKSSGRETRRDNVCIFYSHGHRVLPTSNIYLHIYII